MRNRAPSILFALATSVLLACSARAQGTVTATWNLGIITGNSQPVVWINIKPVEDILTGTNFVFQTPITANIASYPGLTNGVFTTNVMCGVDLQVSAIDGYSVYSTNCYFPTSVAGTSVNAAAYGGTPNQFGSAFFYATSPAGGGAVTNVNFISSPTVAYTVLGGSNQFYVPPGTFMPAPVTMTNSAASSFQYPFSFGSDGPISGTAGTVQVGDADDQGIFQMPFNSSGGIERVLQGNQNGSVLISGNMNGGTNYNAGNLVGTLNMAQVPAGVVTNNEPSVNFGGVQINGGAISGTSFSGNAATATTAANLAGTLPASQLPAVAATNSPLLNRFVVANGIYDKGVIDDANGYLQNISKFGLVTNFVDGAVFYPRFNGLSTFQGGSISYLNKCLTDSNGISGWGTNGMQFAVGNMSTNWVLSFTFRHYSYPDTQQDPYLLSGAASPELLLSFTTANGAGLYIYRQALAYPSVNWFDGTNWAFPANITSNYMQALSIGGPAEGYGYNIYLKQTLTVAMSNSVLYYFWDGMPAGYENSMTVPVLLATNFTQIAPNMVRWGSDTNWHNAWVNSTLRPGGAWPNTNIWAEEVSSIVVFTNANPSTVAQSEWGGMFWLSPYSAAYMYFGESLWDEVWGQGFTSSYGNATNGIGQSLIGMLNGNDLVFNFSEAGTTISGITNWSSFTGIGPAYPNGWPNTVVSCVPMTKTKDFYLETILGRNELTASTPATVALGRYNTFFAPYKSLGAKIVYNSSSPMWTNCTFSMATALNANTNQVAYNGLQLQNSMNWGYVDFGRWITQDIMNTNMTSLPYSGDGVHFVDGPFASGSGSAINSDGAPIFAAWAGLQLGLPWPIALHSPIRSNQLYQVEASLVDATIVNASNFFASGTFTGNGFAGNAAGLTNFIFGWWYGTFSTFSCTANFQMFNPSQTINGGDAASLPSFSLVGADGVANKIADQYSLGLNIQSGGSGHLGNSTFGSTGFTNLAGIAGNAVGLTNFEAIVSTNQAGYLVSGLAKTVPAAGWIHVSVTITNAVGVYLTNLTSHSFGPSARNYSGLWTNDDELYIPVSVGDSVLLTNDQAGGVFVRGSELIGQRLP